MSEEERWQIDSEWETGAFRRRKCKYVLIVLKSCLPLTTERPYSLANLTTPRHGGLRFVRAVKTDDEWTAESRRGVQLGPYTSVSSDTQVANFYRGLVRRSTAQSPSQLEQASLTSSRLQATETKGDKEETHVLQTIQSTSGRNTRPPTLTRVLFQGQGSRDEPLELETSESDTTDNDSNAEQASTMEIPAISEDMYCLQCKTLVSHMEAARHSSSILHLLSKDPQHTVSQPLVPPLQYGLHSSNIGYTMLQRLGWVENTGLGQQEKGRKVPIKALEKFDRKGLGVDRKKRSLDEERQKTEKVKIAAPLVLSKRERERNKRREMKQFRSDLAYLNS